MKKKLLVLSTLVGVLGLAACSSEPAAAPLEAQPLYKLLVNASESGLVDASERNDTSLDSEPINLTVVNGAQDIEGKCGEALQAVEGTEIPTIASASRVISSGEKQVGIAMYSTPEDSDISPMKLYEDIAKACTEPVKDADNTTYQFETSDAVPEGAVGFTLSIDVSPDNRGSSIMMIQHIGNHHLIVAGLGASEEETATVFEAQRTKLEQGTAV